VLTAVAAVASEFLEFASDFSLGTKMNLGVSDTLLDLFFGLLGAVVTVARLSVRRAVAGEVADEA
jgi:hypothetical protein